MRLRLPAFGLVVALVLAGPAAAAGGSLPGTPVPRGFVGMNLDGPPLSPKDNVPLGPQLDQMVQSGVETVRVPFSWATAQPYPSWNDVPIDQKSQFETGAGGVPTSFANTDQLVKQAAARGLTLLPIVLYTPSWDAAPRSTPGLHRPRRDAPYGHYLTTLIDRYGPQGSFWTMHPGLPKRPIRMWQIWNEPDLDHYWSTQPFAPTYVKLLGAAHAAIKQADPGARVVLAGLPNYSWDYLASIYQVRGARSLFDVVAVHPYTKYPSGVITILGYVRQTMDEAGDASKPLMATETGWPSSKDDQTAGKYRYDYETTPEGQASNVRALLPLLAANRKQLGLSGFFFYTWMGNEYPGAPIFNFSGLLRYSNGQVFSKPALAAFSQRALELEHCQRKGTLATTCAQPG